LGRVEESQRGGKRVEIIGKSRGGIFPGRKEGKKKEQGGRKHQVAKKGKGVGTGKCGVYLSMALEESIISLNPKTAWGNRKENNYPEQGVKEVRILGGGFCCR